MYSDGTVEQIPPGIFQSTCKVGRSNSILISSWTDMIWFFLINDQYRQFLTLGGYDLVSLRWTDLRPQVWHLDQPWKFGNSISNLVIWYLWIHLKHVSVRVLDRAHYCSETFRSDVCRWTWRWATETGKRFTPERRILRLSVRTLSGILSGGLFKRLLLVNNPII